MRHASRKSSSSFGSVRSAAGTYLYSCSSASCTRIPATSGSVGGSGSRSMCRSSYSRGHWRKVVMCVGESISLRPYTWTTPSGRKAKRSLSLGCEADASAPSEEDDDSPSAAAAASTFGPLRCACDIIETWRADSRTAGRAPRVAAAQIVVSTIMGWAFVER